MRGRKFRNLGFKKFNHFMLIRQIPVYMKIFSKRPTSIHRATADNQKPVERRSNSKVFKQHCFLIQKLYIKNDSTLVLLGVRNINAQARA